MLTESLSVFSTARCHFPKRGETAEHLQGTSFMKAQEKRWHHSPALPSFSMLSLILRIVVLCRLCLEIVINTQLVCFLLNNGIFHVQLESGVDLGQRGRQRGCGIELLSLLGPWFSFVGFFAVTALKDRGRRNEEWGNMRGRQEIFLRWCWLAGTQRKERERERSKSLFKSQLPSENVLAPSKSLQRFGDTEASRHPTIVSPDLS